MYRIMIQKARSFIVDKKQVLKGGITRTYPIGGGIREEIELAPGKSIYHVTDDCFEILKGFEESGDVLVVEHVADPKPTGKKK